MRRRTVRVAGVVALAAVGSMTLAVGADARGGPSGNLGNGLGRLLAPPAAKGGIRLDQSVLAIRDKQGGVLVDVYAADGSALATVRQRSEAEGLQVTDQSDEHKILEGFVAVSAVQALAAAPGVASVSQALRPYTKVGRATSQGVQAQRVDRVPRGIDGRGITVGALSDSFDTATETIAGDPLKIHAADDIRTGDLPREGVTVLQDDPSPGSTDEGRAMLQIVHDVAPRAKECFATASGGQVNFADNIRALADKRGPCAADVVVDDVGYFDEPVFGDGVIGDAIDDVAAQGTQYFSSAGNGQSQQAYAAPLNIVALSRPDVARTSTWPGSTPRCTRAASRTSIRGRASTSRWTRRWASTATSRAARSSTCSGTTRSTPTAPSSTRRRRRRSRARSPRRLRSSRSRTTAPRAKRSAGSSTRSRRARPTSS